LGVASPIVSRLTSGFARWKAKNLEQVGANGDERTRANIVDTLKTLVGASTRAATSG